MDDYRTEADWDAQWEAPSPREAKRPRDSKVKAKGKLVKIL